MKKFTTFGKYLLVFAIVFLFGWESASYYILKGSADTGIEQEEVSPVAAFSSLIAPMGGSKADLKVFWDVWDLLEENYIDDHALDKQRMVYGAIHGMVAALEDPYTVYMNPDETVEFTQSLDGRLEGIGAELTVR